MIKQFNEFINEDYFSKLAGRKDAGEVRKEDSDNYLKKWRVKCGQWFRWVDLGLPSGKLWCNFDYGSSYMYGAGYYMKPAGVKHVVDNIEGTEYSLPTDKDIEELVGNTNYIIDKTKKCIIFTSRDENNKQKLIFPLGGEEEYQYKGSFLDEVYREDEGKTSCHYVLKDNFIYEIGLYVSGENLHLDRYKSSDLIKGYFGYNVRFVKNKE